MAVFNVKEVIMKKVTIAVFFVLHSLALIASEPIEKVSNNSFYKAQPRWDRSLDLSRIEQELLSTPVKSLTPMAEVLAIQNKKVSFDNTVFLVQLANGLKAVFKPGSDCYAEVAAYRAGYFLGNRLVPPTVLRVINETLGSLQFYVETTCDLLEDSSPYELVPEIHKTRMKLFYFVFGQWDIGYGNRLVQINDSKAHLALIDNAGCSNRQQVQYGDYPFIMIGYSSTREGDWSAPFPFEQPCIEKNISFEKAKVLFGAFLPEDRLKQFWSRHKRKVVFAVWRKGLWVQYYKNDSASSPSAVSVYPEEVLQSYKKLTVDELRGFWREALLTSDAEHYERLITLTLERRDQLVRAAK